MEAQIEMFSSDDFSVERLLGTQGYMNVKRWGHSLIVKILHSPIFVLFFYFFDRLIDGFPIETFKIQEDPHVIIMTEFKYPPATWLECKFCDDGIREKEKCSC